MNSTVEDVSVKEGLPYESVEGALERRIEKGFNNKVKVLKQRCFGIFNFKHLFQRIYLDLHDYRLFAATIISA